MTTDRTALLLMDFMPVSVPAFGGTASTLETVNKAASHARASGMDVVHARVAFRPGHPDVAPSNKIFSAVVEGMDFDETSESTSIHPSVRVEPGDLTVLKRRVSAFAGSDLELLLRSRGVTALVLGGVTTSGVVLSTLRQAADLDFRLTVLADCCADADEGVHRMLLDRVFPAHADVRTFETWSASTGS